MSDMTSTAAIDLLDNLIGMVEDNQDNDYDSALHMAINALKAQSDSDTISRQAAIAIAKDLLIHLEEYHQYNQAINNYCAEIIKLPSAQPEIIQCKD